MFLRFTERAREVLAQARDEARALDHDYIGTEHILLGLIRESGGVAAKALESLEITADAVRQQFAGIIGLGHQAPPAHIGFSPRVKDMLYLSLQEAQQLRHDYIGTEHILLGLIREGDGLAVRVLLTLGANPDRVREQVTQLLR